MACGQELSSFGFLQRNTVGQFLRFASRTLIQRATVDFFESCAHEDYMCVVLCFVQLATWNTTAKHLFSKFSPMCQLNPRICFKFYLHTFMFSAFLSVGVTIFFAGTVSVRFVFHLLTIHVAWRSISSRMLCHGSRSGCMRSKLLVNGRQLSETTNMQTLNFLRRW